MLGASPDTGGASDDPPFWPADAHAAAIDIATTIALMLALVMPLPSAGIVAVCPGASMKFAGGRPAFEIGRTGRSREGRDAIAEQPLEPSEQLLGRRHRPRIGKCDHGLGTLRDPQAKHGDAVAARRVR